MKLKALCFVALVFAIVLVLEAAETSKDEEKNTKEAKTVTEKSQAAEGATFEDGKHYCKHKCCPPYKGCYCCGVNDVVYELDDATGQYVLAGYVGGGWGGGGRGGGGGWGGGGRGGGGGGGWGGGRKCPHCTAEEAYERARGGKP